MTWVANKHNCKLDITRVSCSAGYGERCNPYNGDTLCYLERPILCLKKANVPRPPYAVDGCSGCAYQSMPSFYQGWSEGFIKLTKPVRGCYLTSKQTADKYC